MKLIVTLILGLFVSVSFGQTINKKDSQGQKQGVWKKPYKNNAAFQYVGQFKDDKPYGVFTYYYESGNIQSKITFSKAGTIGYNLMYHESSGYLMAKGKYVNQLKDSLWVYYDNQGQLKSQETYKLGKLDGQSVTYYEPVNGQYRVAKYNYYKDGLLHGQFKSYYPNTKVKAEGVYKDGQFNGMVKYYHGNGRMERVERYKFAVKHGWWIFYDEKGIQLGKELFWEGVKLKPGPIRDKKAAELKASRKK